MIDRLGARLALSLTPVDCGVRVDKNIKMRMIMRITVHMS